MMMELGDVTFYPWQALMGGMLIGVAAFSLHILLGRVAGISGVIGGLLPATSGDLDWRLAFFAGIVGGGAVMFLIDSSYFVLPSTVPSYGRIVGAGLLVGFGTRLGNGCTSGHGVCGIARLSPRSIIATLVFIGTGVATVAIGSFGAAA